MNYRAFGDFRKGYAHVKRGTEVEDYAASYNDPEGRFYIGVICDGHSDNNCFRSSKGSQFGCESAIDVLTRFFEIYFDQSPEDRSLPKGFEERLKKSLKLSWDRKVYNDIKENPLKTEELDLVGAKTRQIYEAGRGLLNIYGATFLAIGMCEDFFLAIHIGDGAILCINEDGTYYTPVADDPKSETGGPASLCDSDLFTRENAFRVSVSKHLPIIATVSSDGIEDCMDSLEYKRFTCSLFKKLQSCEIENQDSYTLNESQQKYIGSCLEYYADKGHGAEDDCSLAAIYSLKIPAPEMKIPHDEAVRLWEETAAERNSVVTDYENRKIALVSSIERIKNSREYKSGPSYSGWTECYEKCEQQKQTLKTIVANEKDKVSFYDRKLDFFSKYIEDIDDIELTKLKPIHFIDENMFESDSSYEEFLKAKQDYIAKKKNLEKLEEELYNARSSGDEAYDSLKKQYKVADEEFSAAKKAYKKAKQAYKKDGFEPVQTPPFRTSAAPAPADNTVYPAPAPAGNTVYPAPTPAGNTVYPEPTPAGNTVYPASAPAGNTVHPAPAGNTIYPAPAPTDQSQSAFSGIYSDMRANKEQGSTDDSNDSSSVKIDTPLAKIEISVIGKRSRKWRK